MPKCRRIADGYLEWLAAGGPRRILHGVPVAYPYGESEDAEAAFAKISAALELIAVHSPRALVQVQRFLKQIVVAGNRTDPVAAYFPDLQWCLLAENWVLDASITPPILAMYIVHEATHGRLQQRGISTTSENRIRIERCCVKAEIALARRLPDAQTLEDWAERTYRDAESVWSEERSRDVRRESERRLVESRVPCWVVAALKWLSAPPASVEQRQN